VVDRFKTIWLTPVAPMERTARLCGSRRLAVQLATKYDAKGKFRNDFLNANIFGRAHARDSESFAQICDMLPSRDREGAARAALSLACSGSDAPSG
jgi:hypothetical protein